MNPVVNEVLSLEDVCEDYSWCTSENKQLEKEITKIYQEMEGEI